jgi:nucleoside-diphosphate-sugar epimerase
MRVLITGAGGNLGRVLAPALAAEGHVPLLLDARPLDSEHESIQGDVRDRETVDRAVQGVDAVIHGAALHGVHVDRWPPQDFWSINATGTFNVLEAMREAGVDRLVLSSTMAVYGESMVPPDGAWGVVTDDSPVLPRDVYGMSKVVCEDLARHYARRRQITTVSLRLGMFVPETFERYGFRLLFGGVDDRDVAHAAVLALSHRPEGGFDAFNIFADVPFGSQDAEGLHRDPQAVLERHWPGCGELFAERGLDLRELIWGDLLWPPTKAKDVLGYRPRYGFGEFLGALRANDPGHYPFAELPWWGVQDEDSGAALLRHRS